MRDGLHAEWTKLRTVAGTFWLLAAAIALTVTVSAAAAAATSCPPSIACPVDPAQLTLTGVQLGQAVIAILAVLAISSEYSTGTIRITLIAMPRRPAVLAAKALILTGLVLAAGPSPPRGPCWPGGSSCPATASPPPAASCRCRWATGRCCAPPPARSSTSP
jgi:ABC-2 type transport system permease protein